MAVIPAGFLAFFSPCILPLLPFALCYFGAGALVGDKAAHPRRVMAMAGAFSLGLLLVFYQIGFGATAWGQGFLALRGVLVPLAAIWLGLSGLGLALRKGPPALFAGLGAALASGMAFGMGLVPCVGPALAEILRRIGQDLPEGRHSGLVALALYGAAMFLPFVLIAPVWSRMLDGIARGEKSRLALRRILALGVAIFAVLLASDRISLIGEWLIGLSDWSWVLL